MSVSLYMFGLLELADTRTAREGAAAQPAPYAAYTHGVARA
ncbi:MAG TPA: hypothetical protein PLW65_19890 [Pseudomonadota bacterium]|nr:hypothetical protein [Pseudomonadota bacterium]